MARSRYYLSGPMTGYPDFNYPAFDAAAKYLRNVEGHNILSAHEIDHGVDPGELTWNEYLRRDLMMMLDNCDSIIQLPGSMNSKGARLEFYVARRLGWPVFTFDMRRAEEGIQPRLLSPDFDPETDDY